MRLEPHAVADTHPDRPAAPPLFADVATTAVEPAAHAADLALLLRDEFRLGGDGADILASLAAVMRASSARERWLVLFNSELGRRLMAQHRDLNTAFGFVLARLPNRPS
jgi:hypothetical protein